MDSELAAYAALALAVVVSPGPDTLLVLRNTLLGGRPAGVATVAGIVCGLGMWGLAAAVGVAAILAASATLFTILKLAGAGYLVYLGVTALRAPAAPLEAEGGLPATRGLRIAVRQGFLSAALNPKLGVFFLTLLPQFVHPGDSPFRSLALVGLFAVIGVTWLLIVTAVVGSLGGVMARSGVRLALQRVTGVLLVALGLRVALTGSR
jgi:threonine/homoserine/homoserine lactone efflux protein